MTYFFYFNETFQQYKVIEVKIVLTTYCISVHFHYCSRFLSVKKWLLRKKHQIELARKRGWKGYWVCLKGTTLLFYPCDSREGRSVEAAPKHLIIVDGAIMQPIPEHPKRDYIFCLSTAFGDAYLFQAPCQASILYPIPLMFYLSA